MTARLAIDQSTDGRLRIADEPQDLPTVSQRAVDRLRSLPTLVVAGDVTAVGAAVVVAPPSAGPAIVAGLGLFACFSSSKLYRSRLLLSVLDDLPRLAVGWFVATALVLGWQALAGASSLDGLAFAVALAGTLITARLSTYLLAQHLRRSGVVAHRSLVIGSTSEGLRIAETLLEHREYGLRPIGFLVDHRSGAASLPLPAIGSPADLARVIKERHVQVAILAHHDVADVDLVKLVRSCHRLRCELFVIPQYSELHSVTEDSEVIRGVPLVRLRRAAHRTTSWRFKRLTDVVVAAAVLAAVAPVMALLAAAVRAEGGPGVIFRQTRIGIDGREFPLLKFRSMRPADPSESATNWNISQDDRVGRVGRFIRKTSLDELPQLFNILRGDMSLVGPRPERPHFVREFSSLYPSYQSRDRVPCGLTGWSQIHGLRGDTSINERADFDNFYIENWSLWLDFKIMLRTATAVFTRPGS